ncbi:hypothetical protein SAXI111661_20720 [Saccharomonospora xinjiangensis]|uniref:Uncharacterized protein n=1 Tax=Saccharomonospora xinjiangensis XJ-54 TaxID=882086 RepID=I0V5R7_9PSEU|nr:hypothetical protein [Saccharomonospora xinjiangensis]EID55470.1 hypothetical protein SacxiDRAFT_3264 [Saccharomonospora xinjiangensis XJ-54]QBQ61549.1 hypothetical protein EYD13_16020 [Saccharomonospora xinjiangensis]
MDDDNVVLSALCNACDGEGRVPDPKCAVIGGVPQTVVTSRLCRWCDGHGYRQALRPPV